MSFPHLLPAVMRERPHRFLLVADVAGRRVRVACGDPGRLETLLFPGACLLLAPAAGELRRTAFTGVLVHAGRGWVSIQPTLANRIVQSALGRGGIFELAGATVVAREVPHGASRIAYRSSITPRGCRLLDRIPTEPAG